MLNSYSDKIFGRNQIFRPALIEILYGPWDNHPSKPLAELTTIVDCSGGGRTDNGNTDRAGLGSVVLVFQGCTRYIDRVSGGEEKVVLAVEIGRLRPNVPSGI